MTPNTIPNPEGIQGKAINRVVSPNDEMYRSKPEHYFLWGAAAYKRVDLTLKLVGKSSVERLLDLPCGHGRELRYLSAAFPEAVITACDIDRDGVNFCMETFGVQGLYSQVQPDKIPLKGQFDLIWCGSLVTHLDVDRWRGLLQLFADHLAPGGILNFSSHGSRIADMMRASSIELGLTNETIHQILASYDRTGFGYGNYPGYQGWGVSLAAPEWVIARVNEIPRLTFVEYVPRGWFDHHDTVACTVA